jgi:catechol 2,3-dioxygenase-like lactoylglutathione lyase family enzyme
VQSAWPAALLQRILDEAGELCCHLIEGFDTALARMITMHHAHLMATDIAATMAFWRHGFGGEIVYDVEFAGARNVFLRIGSGRIHLYDQPPRHVGQGTVHHLGVQTDELEAVVNRLHELGYSVTDIRHEPTAAYAMAEGPDNLLIEIFQPDPTTLPAELHAYFWLK